MPLIPKTYELYFNHPIICCYIPLLQTVVDSWRSTGKSFIFFSSSSQVVPLVRKHTESRVVRTWNIIIHRCLPRYERTLLVVCVVRVQRYYSILSVYVGSSQFWLRV